MTEPTVTIMLPRADLEALLLTLEVRKLPDHTTDEGTDRAIGALRNAWKNGVVR
jgi:hypothetical protein